MKEFNASALVARLSSKPVPAHVFYEYCIYRSTGGIYSIYRYLPTLHFEKRFGTAARSHFQT